MELYGDLFDVLYIFSQFKKTGVYSKERKNKCEDFVLQTVNAFVPLYGIYLP